MDEPKLKLQHVNDLAERLTEIIRFFEPGHSVVDPRRFDKLPEKGLFLILAALDLLKEERIKVFRAYAKLDSEPPDADLLGETIPDCFGYEDYLRSLRS